MLNIQPYIDLLCSCIATPSFSKEEHKTAQILKDFILAKGKKAHSKSNNVWVYSDNFHLEHLPVVLLVSHHDTVRDNAKWTSNPFEPTKTKEGKIIGLGSNDAGASLVALVAAFFHCDQLDLPFRMIVALVAEEEITGINGLRSILPVLGNIDFAIVGEPTNMQAAIAEKGLLVLDAETAGISGHAARKEGINAIYLAMQDINFLSAYRFDKVSDLLGEVHLNVTQIQAGQQHNVIPATCTYVVDVRTNEHYTNQAIVDTLKKHLCATIKARSTHLQSSYTPSSHNIMQLLRDRNIVTFGSPTLSDWCVLGNIPAIKMGPGESRRSHQADEFIYISEIESGISLYVDILENLTLKK